MGGRWVLSFLTFVFVMGAANAQMEKHTFQNAAGSRDYYLYRSAAPRRMAGRPLFVMLHGCTQNATQFADGTQMNALADRFGFDVIYPEQTRANNVMSCWNWFEPENLARRGELSILAEMTMSVANELRAERRLIFVAGLSAGAAMASNLAACYSDVFTGAAIHSGLQYDAAEDSREAQQAMREASRRDSVQTARRAVACSPARSRPLRMLILHGDQDNTVSPKNAAGIVSQFTAINDLLDDGQVNQSLGLQMVSGDSPSPSPLKASFSEARLPNQVVLIRQITIHGMAHAWSGGRQGVPFMEPRGPSASEAIVSFFLN